MNCLDDTQQSVGKQALIAQDEIQRNVLYRECLCPHGIEIDIYCEKCEPKSLVTIGGSLRLGDVITFYAGKPCYPWYKWLWYHLKYMKHNNPMFKPKRQFVVTSVGATQYKII